MAWISPESMSTLMYDPRAETTYSDYVSDFGKNRRYWTRRVLSEYVSKDVGELAASCDYEFPTSVNSRGWTLFVPPFVDRSSLPIDERKFFQASTVERKLSFDELCSSKQMDLETKLPYVKINVFCDENRVLIVNDVPVVKRISVGKEGVIYVVSRPIIAR